MTEAQEKEFRERGVYDDIILMTNLTMIYCHILLFSLNDTIDILGKLYKHQCKYHWNIVRNILDRINVSSLNYFKTSQIDAAQMILDINKDIEDKLVFDDKSLYITFVINQKLYDNIHKFEPEVVSIFKEDIECIHKKLIDYCPVTLDRNKLSVATVVINQIINRIKTRLESDGSLTIIYNDFK